MSIKIGRSIDPSIHFYPLRHIAEIFLLAITLDPIYLFQAIERKERRRGRGGSRRFKKEERTVATTSERSRR